MHNNNLEEHYLKSCHSRATCNSRAPYTLPIKEAVQLLISVQAGVLSQYQSRFRVEKQQQWCWSDCSLVFKHTPCSEWRRLGKQTIHTITGGNPQVFTSWWKHG